MTKRSTVLAAAAVIGFVLAGASARAQSAGEATAAGHGESAVKARPETVRLTIDLTGEGSDVPGALAKLGEVRKAAEAKLKALAAKEGTVEFGEPRLGGGPTDPRQAQMQQMMQMMNRRGGRHATTSPTGVTVAASLKAEWALPSGGADDLLVAGSRLQEKVKAAFAKSAGKPLTPEEQEVMEEMQANAAGSGEDPTAKPGEPQVVFVHRVSDEEYAKAMAEAFAQARREADRLAAAGGMKVTGVRQLSATAGGTDESESPYIAYMRSMGVGGTGGTGAATEATGTHAGTVSLPVKLSVTFSLGAAR
jgi:uncharacterized protein YggE